MSAAHGTLHQLFAESGPAIWAHLWTSTVVLAVALVAARRLARPEARELVLACGLAKLLVPGTLVLALLAAMGLQLPRWSPDSDAANAPVAATALDIKAGGDARQSGATELRCALAVVWVVGAGVTAALFAARRRRAVHALDDRATTVPVDEPLHALAAEVADALRLRRPFTLQRSADGPATWGTWRPIVAWPAHCDTLPRERQRALLAHEIAHVERRDDLRARVLAVVTTLGWFHPLVHLAARELVLAWEGACDARSARLVGIRPYLEALDLALRGSLGIPRLAGPPAFGTGTLQRRLAMLPDAIRPSRWLPYPAAAAIAVAVLAIASVASGFAAPPQAEADGVKHFDLQVQSLSRLADGTFEAYLLVLRMPVDESRPLDEQAVTAAMLRFRANEDARMRSSIGEDLEVRVTIRLGDDGRGTARLEVMEDGGMSERQEIAVAAAKTPVRPPADPAAPEPISLALNGAHAADVVGTFARIIGRELVIVGTPEGTVTIVLENTPWTEALDAIAAQTGFTWRIEDDRLVVDFGG